MGLGGCIVAFAAVVLLGRAGYQNSPLIVLGAGLVALGIVVKIGAKRR
jgi:hypothetical protein